MRKREKWVAFDVSSDLHRQVKSAADEGGQTIREFCVAALEQAVAGDRHSIAVAVPESRAEVCRDLSVFAQGAKQEIIFVGTTLHSLSEPEGTEFLVQKGQEGVRLTFLLFYPQTVEGASLTEALNAIAQRRGADSTRTVQDVRATIRSLAELKSKLPQGQDLVRVMGLKVCPTMGLTIVDPLVPGSRMRASLYVHHYPELFDPALILTYPGSEAEALMYGALYSHYRGLLSGSHELTDLEDAEKRLSELENSVQLQAAAPEPTTVSA